MSVPPVTSNSSAASTGTSDAMKQLSGNFDTFLTLLTTQLKNQDPTSPMDSNQFTQQLVQFSQVEQQIDTNTNLKSLIAQGTTQAGAMATTYLGHRVSVTNGQASLADGAADWTYNLPSTAAAATLTVTNAGNKVVWTGTGETQSGNHSFTWNGKDNNGNALPDGAYTLTVAAKDAAGNDITASVASAGLVGQIDMSGGTPRLVIGNMEVGIADIAAVAN
ncbi:MAG TPA: flagellar hook capping FlgD N-terminal domain-containing protein [Rhizomicrobium sp.]|jgi:flagellar basal-body rod modification protein FlgD|nr:flagellar hook capping FlgD N-terminal domain-containing protein [Rhizomicrobium sp.]